MKTKHENESGLEVGTTRFVPLRQSWYVWHLCPASLPEGASCWKRQGREVHPPAWTGQSPKEEEPGSTCWKGGQEALGRASGALERHAPVHVPGRFPLLCTSFPWQAQPIAIVFATETGGRGGGAHVRMRAPEKRSPSPLAGLRVPKKTTTPGHYFLSPSASVGGSLGMNPLQMPWSYYPGKHRPE